MVREVRKLGCHLERLSNSKERCGEEGSLQDGEGLAAGSAVQQAAGYYLWHGVGQEHLQSPTGN